MAGGVGFVVYEVMDGNPSVIESAQIPTFIGLTKITGSTAGTASEQITFAPLSTETAASTSDPVPRFASTLPGSDCTQLQDCDASYFPKLTYNAPSLAFAALAGGAGWHPKYVQIHNAGGGVMSWGVSVTYKDGADWLTVSPASGVNNGGFRVDAFPQKLQPGVYEAAITIDAGPFAGTRTLPVRFTVTGLPALPSDSGPEVGRATIGSVTNGATFLSGPLAPGSIGTIKGSNLAGQQVSVTFDGLAAKLYYTSADQINFVVPPELGSKSEAQLVVSIDGRPSEPRTVALAGIAPGIFANGILNQDNSVNGAQSPAPVGSVIQIFATGLVSPATGRIWAKIHDRDQLVPQYAGQAPGLTGVDQVNVAIPGDLPGMVTEVLVCASPAANPELQFCSPPVRVALQ